MIQYFVGIFLKFVQSRYSSLFMSVISGIVLPLIFYIVQRQHSIGRKIAHEVVEKILLSTNQNFGSIHNIKWRIWNCGNKPIEISHFQRSITFMFGSHAQVLDAQIAKINPPVIGTPLPSPTVGGNISILQPILFNKRNSIMLQFQVADADIDNMKIDLWISGDGTIDMAAKRKKCTRWAIIFRNIALVLLALWLITFTAYFYVPFAHTPIIYILYLAFAFLISLSGTLSIIYRFSSIAM